MGLSGWLAAHGQFDVVIRLYENIQQFQEPGAAKDPV